jgi:endothelin-converting enzyme/putative endopeptidase
VLGHHEDDPDVLSPHGQGPRCPLGYAQVWCSKYRPEFSRLLATSDPHSPPELRVNLPLRNMPEFQQAFSCEAGSKMTRPAKERCDVW